MTANRLVAREKRIAEVKDYDVALAPNCRDYAWDKHGTMHALTHGTGDDDGENKQDEQYQKQHE